MESFLLPISSSTTLATALHPPRTLRRASFPRHYGFSRCPPPFSLLLHSSVLLGFLCSLHSPLLAPLASVTASGQILFPLEFKTLRNIRIYFTAPLAPDETGERERERWNERYRTVEKRTKCREKNGGGSVAEGGGFYSGSREARKRNKEKTYTSGDGEEKNI